MIIFKLLNYKLYVSSVPVFFVYVFVEYDIICPLITALLVFYSVDGEISGQSLNSMKDAHSLCINAFKSAYLSNEILKRQQESSLT